MEDNSTRSINNDISSSEICSGKIWVTSDTHFNHRNILVYEAANRPFSDRHEMNEALIERWNSKVGKNDLVLHLGDFAFASKNMISEIVSRLNGRIWLLLGNHDREMNCDWKKLGFERVFQEPFQMDGKFILSHEPLDEIPEGKVNIFGHVHGSKYFETKTPNGFCACVERHNCSPVDYASIREMFQV